MLVIIQIISRWTNKVDNQAKDILSKQWDLRDLGVWARTNIHSGFKHTWTSNQCKYMLIPKLINSSLMYMMLGYKEKV